MDAQWNTVDVFRFSNDNLDGSVSSVIKYKVAYALIISPLALRLLRVRDVEGAEGGASWNERRDALDMMKILS